VLLTASRIHDGHNWLPDGTVIEVADDGTILALHDATYTGHATHYDGILVPGLVNAHCHLELSHMKGIIPEHTGLIPFLQQVTFHRNDFTEEQKLTSRHNAYQQLIANGIVAVGDIANGTDTLDLRSTDKLHIHTFIESIGFTVTHAQQRFDYSAQLYDTFAAQRATAHILQQSIVPHAPYSVSKELFSLIDAHKPDAIASIHNQECDAENEFYINKQGAVNDLLNSFGINSAFFVPSGISSLQTYLPWFSSSHSIIFVHNTCSTAADVAFAKQQLQNAFWCLCPNANLYIENRLPDVPMLLEQNATICIGTDSLSSNHQLSVLTELLTLKSHFPFLRWQTLFTWATYNGALALQMDHVIGSIATGKKPGIIHISGLDDGAPSIQRIG